MKKFYSLVIVMLAMVCTTNAQIDANAKKILDAVSAKIKTYKGIVADFGYISKTRAGKVNSNVNGKISIKGQKYYIKQGTTEIFCDGQKSWNYDGGNEVTVSSVDNDTKTLSPAKLLTNFYDKDFNYKLISSAGSFHQIEMVPTDRRKNFQKVNVFIDKAKNMITKAIILDKGQNTISFNLTNINNSATLNDASFVFDAKKYKKKIEVVEL